MGNAEAVAVRWLARRLCPGFPSASFQCARQNFTLTNQEWLESEAHVLFEARAKLEKGGIAWETSQ